MVFDHATDNATTNENSNKTVMGLRRVTLNPQSLNDGQFSNMLKNEEMDN